jgi:hypothetical protein
MSIKKLDRSHLYYLSGGLILAAMMGLVVVEALVWGALWIWHKDLSRAAGDWYVKCMMGGLAAAVAYQQWGGGVLANLPGGITTGALVAVGAGFGLYGQRRGRSY